MVIPIEFRLLVYWYYQIKPDSWYIGTTKNGKSYGLSMLKEKTVTRLSVVDQCTTMLMESILSGELPVGCRLPPERELAEQLGVSRLTLRSALTRVAASGLLEVRQGSGYRVKDYLKFGGPDLLTLVVDRTEDKAQQLSVMTDLLAMRREVARVVLERLANPAERGGISGIKQAVDHFAKTIEESEDVDTLAEADIHVLTSLIIATDSPVYALCINPIIQVLLNVQSLKNVLYRHPAELLSVYRTLQFWIDDPDVSAIGPIMMELVRRDEATIRELARP